MTAITPTAKVYIPTHSFFDSLVTMLFQLAANMMAFTNFITLERIPEGAKRYLASYGWPEKPFTFQPQHYDRLIGSLHHIAVGTINPDELFTLSSRHQPYYAYYYPYRILQPVCSDGWPQQVEIFFGAKPVGDITPLPNQDLKRQLMSTEHTYPMQAAVSSGFISYYETRKAAIEEWFGTTTAEWPEEWRFARVVRNAFAHGGSIDIRSKRDAPATWRNYTFGYQDNGKPILYGLHGLSTVDVILLLEDMHSTSTEKG